MNHSATDCPRCGEKLAESGPCPGCQLDFEWTGGVVDTLARVTREKRAAGVEDFYTTSPFPGYAPGDDGPALLDRCRLSPYLVSIDRATPADGRVLDLGCGTGQIAAFLALSGPRRRVIGADGCAASLACADGFRAKAEVDNLTLVRADLFDLPFPEETFSVVHCRGVIHHTPEPYRALDEVAKRVAPGGHLILGIYETFARAFHCSRRVLSTMRGGKPFRALDPILRGGNMDEEKNRIWIDDQYRHPLEHIMPMPKVLKALEERGFEWVRSLPPAVEEGTGLFDATDKPGAVGRFFLRTGWMLRGPVDADAGLICVVVKKVR